MLVVRELGQSELLTTHTLYRSRHKFLNVEVFLASFFLLSAIFKEAGSWDQLFQRGIIFLGFFM